MIFLNGRASTISEREKFRAPNNGINNSLIDQHILLDD